MAELLDVLTLPLQGSRLIEASAGTGKTWTIAALVVRLVLGHGTAQTQPGPGRPLLPGEILVMTFTRAATRELSDRIRRRLVDAAACFRDEPTAQPDAFLTALRDAYAPGDARQQAAWRLAMAAEAMDEAAVHTIDAWCQRVLREHAFDSGCLFDETLQASEAVWVDQAVRDYWRQQLYPLDAATLEQVLGQWKDINALIKDVSALLDKPLPAEAGQGTLADALQRAQQQRAQALAALKAGWAARADELLLWLEPVWKDKKHPARAALPGQSHSKKWLEALKAWAKDPAIELPKLGLGAQRLTHTAMRAAFGEGAAADIPAAFAEFEALIPQLKLLPEPGPALREHAAACVHERVQQMKAQAGSFGFADMLQRLDAALDESVHGERAARLRQRILDQYPVALIDEFQDTSPLQLRIFDRLYRIASNEPTRALLLIGDPKQAIYSFRGADIYSYLGARQATEGRHHVLGTNHRSTAGLVQAVNALFQAAETRPGEGAFMFRDGTDGSNSSDATGESALPFVPVQAQGRADRFVTAGGDVPALTALVDAQARNAADNRELFAAHCAERIGTLLNDTAAGFAQPGQPLRRLRPADIAVLVRSGTEAEIVREALRRRGLASVYLSDKDTVFQTDEAADLLRLLQAVAAPRDMRLARAALATTLLGLTLDELVALASDDERFDRQCARLQQLHSVWQHQGVLAMIRRALHAFDVPARLLAPQARTGEGGRVVGAGAGTGAGERRLTNVLHLAELLQAASAQAEGAPALMRWLAVQMADAGNGLASGDELVLRLESDADLVQIVTVHKSKGLEYPLVFLPFAALFREVDKGSQAALMLPDEHGVPTLVLAPTPDQLARAEKERQREQLRLLYVALTRARHALWVGLASVGVGTSKTPTWHRSAIGYLLSGPEEPAAEQRVRDIERFAQHGAPVAVVHMPAAESELPLPPVTPVRLHEAAPPLLPPANYTARFERHWAISSYSALVRDAAWGADGALALPVQVLLEDEPAEAERAMDADRAGRADHSMSQRRAGGDAGAGEDSADQPWHRFARGAFAGNFLHDQLEWLAGEGFALESSPALQQALLRRCERQGWGHRADDVLLWLRRVCTTVLPAVGAPLAGLAACTPEMEFWFPSDGLQAGRVDSLCRQHLLPGRARPALPERHLTGMLMGFADLVFEHEGRYWVLDYKSNALGPADADYTPAAMEAAMLEHRYDVQAALYLLALHRLLKARLGAAYVPASHLGGAVYLFLRGIRHASAGCCHVAPPLALLEALDHMLVVGAEGDAGAVAASKHGAEGRA